MNDITELVIIIDRSGSMQSLREDVIGGYNALLENQKKQEGKTLVTTIFFHDRAEFFHKDADVQDLKPIDGRSYQPCGCTALLDAIGDGIAFIKAKHAKLTAEELPAHTIFSIMTDGLENASKEYSYSQIKSMIELQKECGWDFIFQAANIDVEHESRRLGIDANMSRSFDATSSGVKFMMAYACEQIQSVKDKKKQRK